MRLGVCKRSHAALRAARAWPIWELPRWLILFIFATTMACIAAIGLAAATTTVHGRDLLLFGALLACIATTVELTRRAGETAGIAKDVYAVWELPIAVLLGPLYALLAPLIRFALVQWRVRRIPLHRRVFSAAAISLSFGTASVLFHLTGGQFTGHGLSVGVHGSLLLLVVAAAAVLQWGVNSLLVLPAVKASDPARPIRELLLAREQVQNDVVELCVAVLVVLAITITPLTIILSLPFVTLLQRSVRHAQLVNESRIDSKTGLLNAGTWEREAASEVARAVRTRTPLALVLIDIDHFKVVNDLHGHLAGDKALRAIAHTFQIFLRDYDLAGRFGGEEFALLLPQTSATDARQIAERVRKHIAAMPISVDDDPAIEPLQVTVSVGVAALGVSWERTTGSQLTDLLAGADSALYRAKHAGRNQVWMVTDTATVGAARDAGQSANVSVNHR
jgi:diguanylate cyclase (GGDEF)-like protein